jgi:adenine-specific DNA-methyltransferase
LHCYNFWGLSVLFYFIAMSFDSQLSNLLKTDSRFVDESGELLAIAVQDAAWKTDRALIKLLLSDQAIKGKFFEEIDGHHVFLADTFLDYVSQKNFFANSYTRFANRIGLTIDGKYLRERGEVALAWPYKDCVLEGGQTREEEHRKEIFFNEILAHDEINRLLDPKVLSGFARYTTEGKADVTELKRDAAGVLRENLILKGNNLLALHTLKTQFRGKVKLIYIDPPYNTGNDSFGYNDNFNHSAWLTFMKNRLEALRTLMREDGSIWINIDDGESHYLKVLCDEVFGRENFVANVVWQKKASPQANSIWLSDSHDHIIVFARDKSIWRPKLLPRTSTADARYSNPDNDPRGAWTSGDFTISLTGGQRGSQFAKTGESANIFEITTPSGRKLMPTEGRCWGTSEPRYLELLQENRIYFGESGNNVPRIKRFLSEVQEGIVPVTVWLRDEVGDNQESKREVAYLNSSEIFATPKPERLLQRVLQLASEPGDIVLDCFLGSGTTAAVAHKMKRQYIGIEQMNYAENLPVQRLQKVIGTPVKKRDKLIDELEYDSGGISKAVNWQGGGDFVYAELLPYNEAFIDRILSAKSRAELLKIYRAIAKDSFLNWYVNDEYPEKAIADFEAIGDEDDGLFKQKNVLCELLDKNQLYVNLSEIRDTQFGVSQEDQALNAAFYKES